MVCIYRIKFAGTHDRKTVTLIVVWPEAKLIIFFRLYSIRYSIYLTEKQRPSIRNDGEIMVYFNYGSLKYNFPEINELGGKIAIRKDLK
ncbi:hypothetical protein D3C71_2015820 [compost metagenome]